MSRTWEKTRPDALGPEWWIEDAPKGFSAVVALDIDRESFLWAAHWRPPAELAKPWIEPPGAGGQAVMHEAVQPKKMQGRELTLEDAKEAGEEAMERLIAIVREEKIDEMPRPPKASKPKKVARR